MASFLNDKHIVNCVLKVSFPKLEKRLQRMSQIFENHLSVFSCKDHSFKNYLLSLMARQGNYFKFYFGKIIFYSQLTVVLHSMLIKGFLAHTCCWNLKLLLIIVTPPLRLFQKYIVWSVKPNVHSLQLIF